MIKVVVIGCGLIGKRRAQEASAHPHSQLVAVADINLAAAEALASEYNCHAWADWRQALANPEVNGVAVATHNGMLAEIAIAALEAGKHVLIEKPMGRNLAESSQNVGSCLIRSTGYSKSV
jgi:predicted dehydrogenase